MNLKKHTKDVTRWENITQRPVIDMETTLASQTVVGEPNRRQR